MSACYAVMMNNSSNRHHLEELLDLTTRAETSGLSSLDGADALRLGQLYRLAAGVLSRLRRRGGDTTELQELNRLVGRAYRLVYSSPQRERGGLYRFFAAEIPQAIRANIRVIGVTVAVMVFAAMVGAYKVNQDPLAADTLVGRGWSDAIEQIAQRHSERRDWMPQDIRSVMASFIVVNNVKVAILEFALGSVFCVGALYLVFVNGAMMGAVAIGVAKAGVSTDFWAFVAGHGVPEISALVLAAAAGLRMGWALIDPGDYTRPEAFRQAGHDVVRLLMACVLMLMWAASIEAFISPTLLPYSLKFTLSAAEAVVLVFYVVRGGREPEPASKGG